ncbi:hypothetical protein BH09VER1_BH09VER1_28170 [soil metagenome]
MSENKTEDFHLKIDAHALVQLGEQLITDDEQALLELVKNSYDADAEWAKVKIASDYIPEEEDLAEPTSIGLIEVNDNGAGMSRKQLENGWLTISVSLKRLQKERKEPSPKFSRLPLGDKGLGRLGAAKLGQYLCVVTHNSKTAEGWALTFCWNDIQSGSSLETVPIHWRRVAATGSTGTTVRIMGLHDPAAWRQSSRVNRLKVKLSGLISPFKTFQNFDVILSIDSQEIDLQRISNSLRQTATCRFDYSWDGNTLRVEGKIKLIWFRKKDIEAYDSFIGRDEGFSLFSAIQETKNLKGFNLVRSDDKGWFITLNQTFFATDLFKNEEEDLSNPGPFNGSLDFFDLGGDVDSFAAFLDTTTDYKSLIKHLAQIYVYRDGFAVRMHSDWLGLGTAWTSQSGYYSLKPKNVIGFFDLSVESNPELAEKSDREGFTDNEAWRGFKLLSEKIRDVANQALNRLGKAGVKFLNQKRGTFATDEQLDDYGKLVEDFEKLLSRGDEVRSHLATHGETRMNAIRHIEAATRIVTLDLSESKTTREKAKNLLARIERAREEFEIDLKIIDSFTSELKAQSQLCAVIRRKIDEFEERTQIFHDMVAVGLSAQALTHDMPSILSHLDDHARGILKQSSKSDPDFSRIQRSSEIIKGGVESIGQMIEFVQPMLRGRRLSRRKAPISTFVQDFFNLRGARLTTKDITWQVDFTAADDFTISFNPGRFTQIIDNLVTNSEYWISHKFGSKKGGKLLMSISDPELIFSDNGPGILPDMEESLFELFTSGKPREEGNGLGLFITQQFLLRENCSISLSPDRNEDGRLFRFVIDFSAVKTE